MDLLSAPTSNAVCTGVSPSLMNVMLTVTGLSFGFCTRTNSSKLSAVYPSAMYHFLAGACAPAESVPPCHLFWKLKYMARSQIIGLSEVTFALTLQPGMCLLMKTVEREEGRSVNDTMPFSPFSFISCIRAFAASPPGFMSSMYSWKFAGGGGGGGGGGSFPVRIVPLWSLVWRNIRQGRSEASPPLTFFFGPQSNTQKLPPGAPPGTSPVPQATSRWPSLSKSPTAGLLMTKLSSGWSQMTLPVPSHAPIACPEPIIASG